MFRRLALAPLGLLILSTMSSAQTYYTVDVAHDTLCIINVETGVATPIGPMQVHLDNVDLAWHGNALYAKTYGGVAGNKICQIVDDGEWVGYILEGAFLNGGLYAGGEAAGLASDGTSLYLTYTTSNPNDNYSGSFGIVEPIWAGLITQAAPTLPHPHDIDGMGFADGEFWGSDILAPGSGYRIYHGTAATGPTSQLPGSTLYDTATNPRDLAGYDIDWLVALSQDGQNLVRISRADGSRGTVTAITSVQSGGLYEGIAMKPNPCGPFIIHRWH